MNNFQTAQKPRRQPAADPFAFLDRLPRDAWPVAFCRFHGGVRRTDVSPDEIVAWVRRDLESSLLDLGRLSVRHAELRPGVDALRLLNGIVAEFPAEALAFAAHVHEIEMMRDIYRECGRPGRERSAR